MVHLIQTQFVAVAQDDWYARRRRDPIGEFYRGVAAQGPRGGACDGPTLQGIYCCTPWGKLLEYRNAQDPGVMKEVVRKALARWKTEPQPTRQVLAALPKLDARYEPQPPPGGLIVNVFARELDCPVKDPRTIPGRTAASFGASRDHLWLTRDEWHALLPGTQPPGATYPVPAPLVRRIVRFHLVDNVRGEPNLWRGDEIRSATLTLAVESRTTTEIRLRLNGSALLTTDPDPAKAERGYDVHLLGYLTYQPAADRITRFDLVAVGEHWGSGTTPFTV